MKTAACRAVCLVFLAAAASAPADTHELARVRQVFDGDTVLLEDGRKVRYLGINAPEKQEAFYYKAKHFNESLVSNREIRLEIDQEKSDAYGRLLAYVYAGDQLVNARLVQEGLAHAFFIGPDRRHNALLLEAQEKAKRRKVGIWSGGGDKKLLKITSVHRADPDTHAYVRIANLADRRVRLAGYALSNEGGLKYVFPDIAIEAPGYTLIVSGTTGGNGEGGNTGIVHWPSMAWDQNDTAYLTDPSGRTVDMFRFREYEKKNGVRGKTSRPQAPPISRD
ncbi:MAG: thermonuclease family protein [Gammaproteobacteria bacterium]|nr:thermonuclease family protein [Gammaproteobacteria bacterium]